MFLRLFKGSQPILILLIPLTVGLVWLKSFLHPAETVAGLDQWPMPIFHVIDNLFNNLPILRKLIALALLIFNGLYLARMNTKFILIKSRTYLPAVFYALICSSFINLHDLIPALIASTLFIIALEIMFDSYQPDLVNHCPVSYRYLDSIVNPQKCRLEGMGLYHYRICTAIPVSIYNLLPYRTGYSSNHSKYTLQFCTGKRN